jgi:DNA-binding protein YbaB
MKTEDTKTNMYISPRAPEFLRELMIRALEEAGADINETTKTEMNDLLNKTNADDDDTPFFA